ncbi:hypothetical protein BaRGS_00002225 [Batillaria attramentaria]|uniref:Integrator complex subunit 1 n=1 Tax=Batillaria attramentaria TaxID=370345 RepID=A0ABD0M4B0_9CAEN
MERQKAILGKKPKNRGQAPPPGDFIALGKSNPPERSDPKRPASPQPVGGRKLSVSGAGVKRDAAALPLGGSGLAAKKPKVSSQTFTPLGRPLQEAERKGSPAPSALLPFEEAAIEVEPAELLTKVLDATEEGDEDKTEGLLCGAVKQLRSNRSKPDPTAFLTLMYIAKTSPTSFHSETTIEAFCSMLKRDLALNFKAKGNPLVSVFACNILMAAFAEEENWPDNYVKVYLDDSLGERVWVDREDCRGFVDNIQTAFKTKQPPRYLLVGGLEPSSGSPVQGLFEEDEASKSSDGADSEKSSSSNVPGADVIVFPRYPCQQSSIQAYVLDVVREQLARRQTMDASCRNLIRLMASTAGYGEIRSMASQRIEMWLQNPKLTRTAQDLLLAVCTNCNQEESTDTEVITQLLKIRLKTKPLINHYLTCIRELLAQHPDNLHLVLKQTIYNELSSARNPNNMSLLGIVFSHAPESASKILAEVFQDLLANKDDYLRALRALLREIVRATRQDMNFAVFCLGLMQERQEPRFTEVEPMFKERYVMSVADLISLTMLLGITPAVRDATARSDHKELEVIHKFKHQIAVIERDAIWWMHTVVPKIMEIKHAEYVHCLRKVLFMESPEHYYNKDNWPPEADRNFMLRMVCEAPVLEDTLMRIMVIGLSRDLPLSNADAVDMVDQLIRRAASLYSEGMQVLQVEKLEVIDALLNLCAYRYPENIILPKGYTPPTLAISNLYWKAWALLLIIAAFNPSVFGAAAWEKYPVLKCLMEMVMTNNFTFPPPTMATDEKMIEDIRSAERQLAQQEVQMILEFESHLAAATSKVTITQQNSLLLDQLTSMDPTALARCPPQKVLDQLELLNSQMKIGQMLCRSRNPDFLLDIIQRQGTSQSMPWLAELVEASEGSLDMLPVQCLCEFLLHDPKETSVSDTADDEGSKADRHRRKQKIRKHRQLLEQLQALVHSSPENTSTMFDVLNYFLQRLASSQATARQQAIKGLSMVMSKPSDGEDSAMEVDGDGRPRENTHAWLLKHMPSLPTFPEVKVRMCDALRQACQVESDPHLVSGYIIFLSQHAMDQSLHILDDLALDISQLIVERNSVMNHILPDLSAERKPMQVDTLNAFLRLFYSYLQKARRQEKGEYSWSNTQDQIILQWKSGESATMHILVVHAMVIILTYGRPANEEARKMYSSMLEIWFPQDNHMPKAFLLDTSEEALLLPDWLKLRMIRSSEGRLVSAALQELDPRQLILFVQSFGIPVSSMSCLLACLDTASEADPGSVVQAVSDRTYMAQLIHIQKLRGASAGHKFYSLLTDGEALPDEGFGDEEMAEGARGPSMWHVSRMQKPEPQVSASGLARDIPKLFSPQTNSSEAAKLLQSILKKLDSAQGKELALHMLHNTSKSCPLVKLFISKHEALHDSLYPVLQSLLAAARPDSQSSLKAVIEQFFRSKAADKPISRRRQASIDLEGFKCGGKVNPHRFIAGIEALGDKSRLEPLVQQYMQEAAQQQRPLEGINAACTMLQQAKKQNAAQSASVALPTDWLEFLDPEIVSASVERQESLVFGLDHEPMQTKEDGAGKRHKSSPYLLALLTHQSQWSTIQRCLNRILSKEKITELNPTAVLDFVWACRHIPKIWQGRERKSVQGDDREDVFGFSTDQLLAVVDYIALEASLSLDKAGDRPAASESKTATAVNQRSPQSVSQDADGVSHRLDLLLSCICDDDDKIGAIVTHVQNKAAIVSSDVERMYVALLQELYLHFPYILAWLPPNGPLSADWLISEQLHSQLDTVTHRLITVLGKAGPGKASENRMYDANITCRKMAVSHPMLILRQLPLLAAVLGGRTQLSLGEMRHRNLLLLFTHVLGLLELLQPHIFSRQHSALSSILESFFALFRAHGRETRQLGSLVSKFMVFLQNFVTHDPQRASTMLQQYIQMLSDLSTVYPDMSELKSLLTGLTMPRQNQSDGADVTVETEEPGMAVVKSHGGIPFAQVEPFIKRLQATNSSEELQRVLADLDETSKRKVGVLEHFESELKRLMEHVNDRCRNFAFTLIMRFLHSCPRRSQGFLPNFLHCLSHDNPDVVMSALKNLAEFAVLCQDDAQALLQRAFHIGVTTTVDTQSYIKDTLQLLNLESVLTSS